MTRRTAWVWTAAPAYLALSACGDTATPEPPATPTSEASTWSAPAEAEPTRVDLDLGDASPPSGTPGDPVARDRLYLDAKTLVASGQFGKAIRRLERAIETGPEDGKTRLLLGICRSNDRDDMAGARVELRRAHRLDDGVAADAAYYLAELDRKLAHTDRAGAWLAEALRIDPGHAAAQVGYARWLRRVGQEEEAEALLERHLREHPESAPGYHERGALRVRADRVDDAIADFRRATELDPTDTASWFQLATALRREGKTEAAADAQRDFELLKAVFSESRHDMETDPVRREAILREIIERFPSIWRADLELAHLLASTSGPGAAVRSLGDAVQRHPAVPELRAVLAAYLEQGGDAASARVQREQAQRMLSAGGGS